MTEEHLLFILTFLSISRAQTLEIEEEKQTLKSPSETVISHTNLVGVHVKLTESNLPT